MDKPLVTKLQQKKMFLLHEHLEQAILNGKILSVYKSSPQKASSESEYQYLERFRNEAAEYQFVSINIDGTIKYVCFGILGPVVTNYGEFLTIPAEVVGGAWGIHHFLFYPDLETMRNSESITIRMDSGCFSGMVLGDKTCDCLEQLRNSQKLCVKEGGGIIIEIPGHDGRGWGEYKMANQKIMRELGYDTITTAELFYGDKDKIDIRSYDEAIIILKAMGFGKHGFRLATSNPYKVAAFRQSGMRVLGTDAVKVDKLGSEVLKHLNAKLKLWQQVKEE